MAEIQSSPILRMPQIQLVDELESTLPLEHTNVTAQVTGPVASVVVTQRFGNPLKEPAELDYLFPLPEDAAVTGFELIIGSRRITGDLQEREAAQAAYEEARDQGKRAGLFEQRRPNLFVVRLANIQAGETILATLRYQQRLKFEDGSYEFLFPMGLTPKFDSPDHPGEGEGTHAPIAPSSAPVGSVEISLAVDAGIQVEPASSPSHAIETTQVDGQRFQVRLAGEHIPDHDFILRYAVAGGEPQAAGWLASESTAGSGSTFLATLVPPRMEDEIQPLPREFIFVLDRSGSMSGQPILQARNALRACLRTLNPGDTFRILLFDNDLEWFRPEPLPAAQAQVDQADAYLNAVQGRGGTEIVSALEAALALPLDKNRTRFIVFLTDGAVSAEARVLEGIRRKLGGARLFTFGIGPSVNRALLSRMAALGRGRSSFLQLDEDIEGAIIRFQDSVSFPAITDLSLEWSGGKTWDTYPTQLPDLYYDQPLEICGRAATSAGKPLRLVLRGKRAGKPVSVTLEMIPGKTDPAIPRVWARARVDALQEQAEMEPGKAGKLRDEIIALALEHNLVTAYTSFVAIDQEATASGGQPRVIHIAQPLPQGLDMAGFVPGAQTFGLAGVVPPSPAAFSAPPPQVLMSKMSVDASFDMSVQEPLENQMLPQPNYGRASKAKLGKAQSQPTPSADPQAVLRWLGRSQKMDGSWNDSLEWTAVAVLAFVRAGHTTRAGSYRQQMRRAARWLADHPGQGLEAALRARALEELAQASGDSADRAAADLARRDLTQPPVSVLEAAARGETVPAPGVIASLDDLRLAVLLKAALPIPAEVLQDDLARVWAAAA